MSFIKILRRVLPKFDSSLQPSSLDDKPDLIWQQEIKSEANRSLRIASTVGLIFTVLWLLFLNRPLRLTDALPFVIVIASLILSYTKATYLLQAGMMYAIMYITSIVLLGSQNTVGQSHLLFFACILGVSWLIGIKWAGIVLAVSTLLLASFSCGILAPFSFNCTVEYTQQTIIGNLAVFMLTASLGLTSFYGITNNK